VVKAWISWIYKSADIFLTLIRIIDAVQSQSIQRILMQVSAEKNATLARTCEKCFISFQVPEIPA